MNNKFNISFDEPDLDIFFEVHLDNNTIIYEDKSPKCWLRVNQFLQENKTIKIKKVVLRNRAKDISIQTPNLQVGYFYGKKLLKNFRSKTLNQFVGIGYYNGDEVIIKWFTVPDFSSCSNEKKTKERAGFMLIHNNG